MADNVNIQESPPEVQFAGVNRWLRENLFSSTGSAILTFVSIGALIGLFRSIIGFFISPEREWTAITYNLRLYMVQAYPESDFIRVWITIGLVMGLLGLTWGFNSVNEKSSLKSTGTTLMLASTTGIEVGDFVVVTSDHAPAPAGAYVTSISSGASW